MLKITIIRHSGSIPGGRFGVCSGSDFRVCAGVIVHDALREERPEKREDGPSGPGLNSATLDSTSFMPGIDTLLILMRHWHIVTGPRTGIQKGHAEGVQVTGCRANPTAPGTCAKSAARDFMVGRVMLPVPPVSTRYKKWSPFHLPHCFVGEYIHEHKVEDETGDIQALLQITDFNAHICPILSVPCPTC